MKGKEYFRELKKLVDEGFAMGQGLVKERKDLQDMVESGNYSYEYLRDTIHPRLREIRDELSRIRYRVNDGAQSLTDQIKEGLEELDALNPEELTEDAKLFQSGIPLRKNDLEQIIKRNPGNRTMAQLVFRYAEDNKIDLGGNYVNARSAGNYFNQIRGNVNYVSRWIGEDERTYRKIYDLVFSDNSETARICNSEDFN